MDIENKINQLSSMDAHCKFFCRFLLAEAFIL